MTPKTNIATTSSQSRRLLECGVDPKTADMVWTRFESDGEQYERLDVMDGFAYEISALRPIPAWSLSTLLSLLPKEIYDESGDSFYFSLAKEFPLSEEYGAAYIPCWDKGDALVRKRDNDPIEACVQLIEWLTANNYQLNQTQSK